MGCGGFACLGFKVLGVAFGVWVMDLEVKVWGSGFWV